MIIGGVIRRAFASNRVFSSEDILERMRLFRDERSTGIPPEMFRYPSYLQEINARELQLYIQSQGIPDNVALLHSIAHIEFNAFSAYADTYYRFSGGLPQVVKSVFQKEVSEVALEEATHFRLLHERLKQLGYPYGSVPVITGLTKNIAQTSEALLDRLVVISLVQEGKGLDASGRLIAKIRQLGDRESQPILQLIAREEVGHVAFGVRWVQKLSEMAGVDSATNFLDVLKRRNIKLGNVDKQQRKKAGFPEAWLTLST